MTACIYVLAQVTQKANWLDGFGSAGGMPNNGEGEQDGDGLGR